MAKALNITIILFLIASNLLVFINSARLLDEIQPQSQLVPTGQIPTVAPTEAEEEPAPATTVPAGPAGATAGGQGPLLEFFMHDVLGGSHPSARVVTGIVAQTEVNGIPFSKASNSIFPVDNGVPLVNSNNINSVINPNTAPLLTGLSGAQTSTVIQNTNGNSNDALSTNSLPFVTAGNLPPGAALQHLMFGTITVVDDELTESHELGEHDHHDTLDDAISFFGVHRTASHASQIAVIGGTGKFEHAKGYAIVETLHNQNNQHITDGQDTILHFSVYLTYKA
ncbi:Dirigent protein 9 [Raphanus sativus]|nr:Dirigent protein 9 [Raphanus sativus]